MTVKVFDPFKWYPDLPTHHNGEINVEGYWIGNYANYIFSNIFNFCACGCPEDTLAHIRDGMRLVKRLRDEVQNDDHPLIWSEWNDECLVHFGGEAQKYFMFYWFDEKGLTDHGGSVPGWLTEMGEQILDKLD